mmetsp:Transcript_88194/g.248176  ORF Transcript_88194/g.248176 Transcript_88194/m.248176 type:complete len:224 (+) Transcript_88194:1894-2565(+)
MPPLTTVPHGGLLGKPHRASQRQAPPGRRPRRGGSSSRFPAKSPSISERNSRSAQQISCTVPGPPQAHWPTPLLWSDPHCRVLPRGVRRPEEQAASPPQPLSTCCAWATERQRVRLRAPTTNWPTRRRCPHECPPVVTRRTVVRQASETAPLRPRPDRRVAWRSSRARPPRLRLEFVPHSGRAVEKVRGPAFRQHLRETPEFHEDVSPAVGASRAPHYTPSAP